MRYLLGILCIGLLLSCANDPAVSPNYTPGWQPPVVTGMSLTNEMGLSIGTFGNPKFPENTEVLQLESPFPNPGDGQQTIQFALNRTSKVKVWVVPARWINEQFSNSRFGNGSTLIDVSGGKAIEILIDGTEFSPGVYSVRWDSNDNIPMFVPGGFYRIFVQASGVTLWKDIYECDRFKKAPYGLDKYSEECR